MEMTTSTSGENSERLLANGNTTNINNHQNTLSAITDIVHAIFGPSVGPCRAAFTCNYQRIHGRLYLSTRAVLFYSILFGYERRLCLPLGDIIDLSTYRTTSIRIEMVDCEVHIFKTLKDRDHVFQLVLNLKRSLSLPSHHQEQPIPKEIGFHPQPSNGSFDEDDNNSTTIVHESTDFTQNDRFATARPPETMPLRQRSISLPVVLGSINESQEIVEPTVRKRSDGDLDSSSSDSQGMHHVLAWGQAKQKKYEDIAVESVTLPCSLDKFFDMFLADNAPHSLDKFQLNVIGDTEVEISAWELQRGRDQLVRTASCLHKLKNSLGPSHARTTRRQRLQRFGDVGIGVESTISVAGVPAADCFTVADQWLIEAVSGGIIRFSVRFQTNFTKRTILKGVIQSSTRTETKQWFASYVKMMEAALSERETTRITSKEENNVDVSAIVQALKAMNLKLHRMLIMGSAIGVILLLALLLHFIWLQRFFIELTESLRMRMDAQQAICQAQIGASALNSDD